MHCLIQMNKYRPCKISPNEGYLKKLSCTPAPIMLSASCKFGLSTWEKSFARRSWSSSQSSLIHRKACPLARHKEQAVPLGKEYFEMTRTFLGPSNKTKNELSLR
uniref:Uncharacterized protein n=1 Tax=Opuntia streptacantha TaxID=393608 RepID=A0A7C8ZCU4_OPUST